MLRSEAMPDDRDAKSAEPIMPRSEATPDDRDTKSAEPFIELRKRLIEIRKDTEELMETYLKLFDREPPDWSLARWQVRAFSALRAASKARTGIEASIARITCRIEAETPR